MGELDKSGLTIGTSSGSMMNIFGEKDVKNKLIKSLMSKYIFISNFNIPTIDRTAYDRDICCVERMTDISIIIAVWLNYKYQIIAFIDNLAIKIFEQLFFKE